MSSEASRSLNALGLLAVCGVLLGAYYFGWRWATYRVRFA
jgi:hypothetical protein